MNNKNPCNTCTKFDQKEKNLGKGKRGPAWYGWCVARSTYPNELPAGHILPEGAKQVGPKVRHLPVIVGGEEVVSACLSYIKKEG